MRIFIHWMIYTDGDFKFPNYKDYNGLWDGDYIYTGNQEFVHENEIDCMVEAREYLEGMLCDMRVLPNHYHILSYLYVMFDSLIRFVGQREPGSMLKGLPGNYDLTTIRVEIEK